MAQPRSEKSRQTGLFTNTLCRRNLALKNEANTTDPSVDLHLNHEIVNRTAGRAVPDVGCSEDNQQPVWRIHATARCRLAVRGVWRIAALQHDTKYFSA